MHKKLLQALHTQIFFTVKISHDRLFIHRHKEQYWIDFQFTALHKYWNQKTSSLLEYNGFV